MFIWSQWRLSAQLGNCKQVAALDRLKGMELNDLNLTGCDRIARPDAAEGDAAHVAEPELRSGARPDAAEGHETAIITLGTWFKCP